MLILTRRVNETLVIGDDIKVHVLGVQVNQVRIGIDAPKNVSVHREEVYDRIQAGTPAAKPKQEYLPLEPVEAEPITSNSKLVNVVVKKSRKVSACA